MMKQTWEAIRAHLFPSLAWSWTMRFSSSEENAPFLRLGRKWLAHLSLQLFPHLISPEFLWTAFQFPSPCFFTYSIKMASSAAVQGPFFIVCLDDPPPFFAVVPPLFFDARLPSGAIKSAPFSFPFPKNTKARKSEQIFNPFLTRKKRNHVFLVVKN